MSRLDTDLQRTSKNIIHSLLESANHQRTKNLKESENINSNGDTYYYNDDYNERTKYLIGDISDISSFIKLLIQEFGEYEYEDDEDKEADYNYEEGGHVIRVGGTTFYTNKEMNDIWSYDDDPYNTMKELLDNEAIVKFLLSEGLISGEDEFDESAKIKESVDLTEERLGNNTFTDKDEAEYYRNKELYHQSGLERHKEAMNKAKEACKNKGIEVDETKEHIKESENLKEAVFEIDYAPDGQDLSDENSVYDSVNKWLGPIADAVDITVVELNGPSGWPVVRLSGNEEELADFLHSNYNSGEDSIEDIKNLYMLKESEDLTEYSDEITEVENRIADLQDYINNTPDISKDELIEIQNEIDELLDEINFIENGLNKDAYEESVLTEAPNPENEDINKKILATIRTKKDMEPRYKSDLEAAGLKVEPNKYDNSWNVIGSNGRKLSKDAFMGGKSARFNSNNNKVADYYNMLTKEVDNDKNWQNKDLRSSKPIQRQDKWHHYNKETNEWEPGTDYSRKEYDRRQKNSMGYNFDDLRGGSKDIRDYKQAQGNENFHSRAKGWSQDDIDSANKKLADFQASISDKIAELQRNIDRAKENYNSHVSGEEQAKQAKQDILNRKREARNK